MLVSIHGGNAAPLRLTSVMLALHPGLVDLAAADEDLHDELQTADAARGRDHLERFVASIVREVRRQLVDRHSLQ